MPTQKELLNKHREGLDARYAAKYPSGRFALQRWEMINYVRWGLHWAPRRNTSHTKYWGITVQSHDHYGKPGIAHEKYQNNSFGSCKNYTTLAKLIAAAHTAGCPADMLDAFVQRYNARANEGFKI